MAQTLAKTNPPRIKNAGVGTAVFRGRQVTVIRGDLDTEYFDTIDVPGYQRMAMEHEKHEELKAVLAPDGIGVPDDLLLCTSSTSYEPLTAGEILLATSSLSLLDGHQRYNAAMARIAGGQKTQPFGVKIFLGTTLEEEVAAFYQVNRLQTKVSSNVFMRNRQDNAAIMALRELEKEVEGFPPVTWDQLTKPGEKIRAHTLYEVAIILHGFYAKSRIEDLFDTLEQIQEREGTVLLKKNVRTFFDAVHASFGRDGLEDIKYRVDLLRGLASLFRDHNEFWQPNGRELIIRKEITNKLATLSYQEILRELQIKGSKNMTRVLLRHIEKGRRTGHLTLRRFGPVQEEE